MSSADAFTSIEDYLRDEWATTPLIFENETWPLADDPTAFVFVEIFGNLFAQESIGAPGANLWREEGEIRAHVLVPNGTGTATARAHAGAIADLFREVEVGGIWFREMSIGAGEPGDADGNYYRLTVTIDWVRDDI